VADGSDGSHPLRWSQAARTEICFADDVCTFEELCIPEYISLDEVGEVVNAIDAMFI